MSISQDDGAYQDTFPVTVGPATVAIMPNGATEILESNSLPDALDHDGLDAGERRLLEVLGSGPSSAKLGALLEDDQALFAIKDFYDEFPAMFGKYLKMLRNEGFPADGVA